MELGPWLTGAAGMAVYVQQVHPQWCAVAPLLCKPCAQGGTGFTAPDHASPAKRGCPPPTWGVYELMHCNAPMSSRMHSSHDCILCSESTLLGQANRSKPQSCHSYCRNQFVAEVLAFLACPGHGQSTIQVSEFCPELSCSTILSHCPVA